MRNWVKVTLAILLLVLPLGLMAADGKIKGKVTDVETGRPLAGANVVIVGTTHGAASGATGVYEIRNLPAGTYSVKVMFMGYKNDEATVTVTAGQPAVLDFQLQQTTLMTQGTMIQAARAVERESPIAFSTISGSELAENYTTGDMPDIIKYVPGVFTATGGLGESEMWVRGFEADKVQIMINGIPVNDPESQHVYWSNWTGLSSNTQSVQVQRGAGSSLYGSGVFGGSVNIETMGLTPNRGVSFRSSVGYYNTEGSDAHDGKVADGHGGFESYNPMNYNASFRYNSGLMYDGKLNYSVMVERKAGDSYANGTYYDGWSFGLEAQSILGAHKLLFSFIGAPQWHNQARTMQDFDLLKTLGREYNRYNHKYQENYYFKPQASLRHEWTISDKQFLQSNVFVTMGVGGGKYLKNDKFDVTTGEVYYMPLSAKDDTKYYGRHARYIYENTGYAMEGYDPEAKTFFGEAVSYGTHLINGDYNHSWQNDSRNDHKQFGLNTNYQHQINDMVRVVVGGEYRFWAAQHYAYSWNFRDYDETLGIARTVNEVQMRYDYDTDVTNVNGFARIMFKPMDNLTLQADGQYSYIKMVVEENPIEIFNFGTLQWTGHYFYNTKDIKNADGTSKFSKDDYTRDYSFFSPKFGANYNVNQHINVMGNFSIAKKEPKSYHWYNRDYGPGANQKSVTDIDPEKITNMEMGVGYNTATLGVNVNVYNSKYEDRIESIRDEQQVSETINAGNATHQGVELSVRGNYGKFDVAGSLTWAKNRWDKMNDGVATIFSTPAEDVVDKVVPFSPERMANGTIGYQWNDIRFGLGFQWWDENYATYSNDYEVYGADGQKTGEVKSSKLPSYFDLSFNVAVPVTVAGKKVNFRLDLNNITNRDNIMKAAIAADYGRTDALNGKYYWYVLQAPMFNAFLTTEISL